MARAFLWDDTDMERFPILLICCCAMLALPHASTGADMERICVATLGEEEGGVAQLGYGWSRPEHGLGRRFRWISELEADIWVDVPHVGDRVFSMTAAIPHLHWRRQRIGLFVNNRYVTEWPAPDDAAFHEYRADLDGRLLEPGRNRITLRMAYRTRIGRDSRRLALAVEAIALHAPAAEAGE